MQAQRLVEAHPEGDHLHVRLGIVGAERLHAHLTELAVPAGLRALVAELRAVVPDLPGRGRPVLGEGTAHAGGQLGPEREMPRRPATVVELEQLLGDHLGGLAQALEHTDVLEHGRLQQTEAGPLREVGEHVDQPPPP